MASVGQVQPSISDSEFGDQNVNYDGTASIDDYMSYDPPAAFVT